MLSEKVVKGARLIDQLEKLNDFLREAPANSDTLTITFRAGKYSRSLSVKDDATITNIRSLVESVRDETIARIQELGIEL
jgi:hypothetical protein